MNSEETLYFTVCVAYRYYVPKMHVKSFCIYCTKSLSPRQYRNSRFFTIIFPVKPLQNKTCRVKPSIRLLMMDYLLLFFWAFTCEGVRGSKRATASCRRAAVGSGLGWRTGGKLGPEFLWGPAAVRAPPTVAHGGNTAPTSAGWGRSLCTFIILNLRKKKNTHKKRLLDLEVIKEAHSLMCVSKWGF